LRPALLAFARLTVSFAEGGARAPRPGLRGRSPWPDRRRRRLLMHRFEGGRGVNDRTTMFVSDSPGCRRRRGVAAAAWLATVYLTIIGQNVVLELTTGFYVRLPMSSLIPGIITDVAVLTLGTMLGRAIYKGRYYRVAALVVTFTGCLWVFLLAVMIASGDYGASVPLRVVHGLIVASALTAMWGLKRAWRCRQMPVSADAPRASGGQGDA
jgi:hypothetical protein